MPIQTGRVTFGQRREAWASLNCIRDAWGEGPSAREEPRDASGHRASRGCVPRGSRLVSRPSLALGVAIETTRKLRIVSLGRRNEEVHVRSELETILVIVARREHRLGVASVLAHEPSHIACLLYTSPSPRDRQKSRMPSS